MEKIRPLDKYQQHYLKKQFGDLFTGRAKNLIPIVNSVNTCMKIFEHTEKAVVYDENQQDFFLIIYTATLNKHGELSNYETYDCYHFNSFNDFQDFASKENEVKLFNKVKHYLIKKEYEHLNSILPIPDNKIVKSKI